MTIPNAMRYRISKLEGLSKQKINMPLLSGQTAVVQGQTIIVDLPYSSLCDLSTFEMKFLGETNQGPSLTAQGARVYSFPRYIQSIIQGIEIRFNNKTVQHIVDYNLIYNTLADLTIGDEGKGKHNTGTNYDPSKKYIGGAAQLGYAPVAIGNVATDIARDRQTYVIRNWLGLLGGNASTTCIDTNLIGSVQIRITLAPATVLSLGGPFTDAATDTASAAGYTLNNINFSIMTYDMPPSFYDEVRSYLLTPGNSYSIYFPHYNTFYGSAKTTKSNTVQFSLSTQSLDYLIGTFLVANREVAQFPYNSLTAWNDYRTQDTRVATGALQAFNQSVYFQRNGENLATSQWDIGGSRMPSVPEDVLDCFNSTLQAFNLHNDTLGGCHSGLMSLHHFREAYFTSVLSLQWSGDGDGTYLMSGLNTKELPIQISWNTVADAAGVVPSVVADHNNIGTNGSYGLPFVIAAETKQVDLLAGRMSVVK